MTTFISFITIFSAVLLLYLFFKLFFENLSPEKTILATMFSGIIIGFLLTGVQVEVIPIDLVFFSISLLLVYAYSSAFDSKEVEEGNNNKKSMEKLNRVDRVATDITKSKKVVFEKIEKNSDLDEYFFLKIEFEKGNVSSKKFKERYMNFYNMKVFNFSEKFLKKYFNFLEIGETDLRKILKVLSGIKNKNGKRTVQLAFASKLIHTVDADFPLYNSAVSEYFNLNITNGTIEEKIDSSVDIYQELISYHKALANREKVKKAMNDFREDKNLKEGILSDAKLIDLFIKAIQKI